MYGNRSYLRVALAAAIATMVCTAVTRAQDTAKPANAACFACHGVEGLSATRPDGISRQLFVSQEKFAASVHGKVLQCVDCHSEITQVPHATSDKTTAARSKTRLAINKNCGNCHPKDWLSYTETYHGQVLALGFDEAATCFDCHGAHDIQPVKSRLPGNARDNMLKSCQACHQNATPGFATFQPHAVTNDLARYPHVWITSKFVNLAVGGVLVIFWIHSALWFYREFADRRRAKLIPHVLASAVPGEQKVYYQRWTLLWRAAHLVFAVTIILLVMTGVTLLYPNSSWAPALERAMGGPTIAGFIHRVSAVVMIALFVAHIVYAALRIARNWKTFKVFGPYSLMPNWQDGKDIAAMIRWFFGRGPRPVFDHWNYQQKVDYWAPFWGIAMLAATGAVLWFKTLAAAYLPGWAFNVAAVAHGDEALLAAAYLFTVHYFVNHWRPDKFPLDLVIFTGSMPLEEFKREYEVEYNRLLNSGELQQYLVSAPSRPMRFGSMILGFALVLIGLALLILMAIGVVDKLSLA